jgi:CheY-like chemotaxis protein
MQLMPRILVIEDEADVRHGLVRVLANAGYQVVETASGGDGLRLYREQGADLVLTDIIMPDTNGIEVIRGLQVLAPGLPVIAMSAGERSRDFELLANAQVLGAVSLLRKPFSKQELLSVVAAALGKGTRGDPERPVPA